MSVIIRLQNLPWSANALDIRQYFHGLSIPEGGVHIVGGEQGDAFIAFSTDEDARQGMMADGGKIKEVKVKLFLSSRTEMQKVIETARQQTLTLQNFMQLPPQQATPPLQPPPIPAAQHSTAPHMMGGANAAVGILGQLHVPHIPGQQQHVLAAASNVPPHHAHQTSPQVVPSQQQDQQNNATESSAQALDKKDGGDRNRGDRRNRSRSRSRDNSRRRSRDKDRDRHRRRGARSRSRSRDRSRRKDRSRERSRSRDRGRDRRGKSDKDSKDTKDKDKQNGASDVVVVGQFPAGARPSTKTPVRPSDAVESRNMPQPKIQQPPGIMNGSMQQQQQPMPGPVTAPNWVNPVPSSGILPAPNRPAGNPMLVHRNPNILDPTGRMPSNFVPPSADSRGFPYASGQDHQQGWMPPHQHGMPMPPQQTMPQSRYEDGPPHGRGGFRGPPGRPTRFDAADSHGVHPDYRHAETRDGPFPPHRVRERPPYEEDYRPGPGRPPYRDTSARVPRNVPHTCIEIRNLPTSAAYRDVRELFQGMHVLNIKLLNDEEGRRTGVTYVKFMSLENKEAALSMNGVILHNTPLQISHIDDNIYDEALDSVQPNSETVIVALHGLPHYANEQDIRRLFPGARLLNIVMSRSNNPHSPQAFVQFSTLQEGRRALGASGKLTVDGKDIFVERSNLETLMNTKKMVQEMQGHEPRHEPRAEGHEVADKKLPARQETKPAPTDCVLLQGLPPSSNDREILDFFSDVGLVPLRIHVMLDSNNTPFGDAFCEFSNANEGTRALAKNGNVIGTKEIAVRPVTREEMQQSLAYLEQKQKEEQAHAAARPAPVGRPGPMPSEHVRGGHMGGGGGPMRGGLLHPGDFMGRGGRQYGDMRGGPHMRGYRGMHHGGPPMMNRPPHHPSPHEAPTVDNFGKPGCVIELQNVPYKAEVEEIIEYFEGFDVARSSVIRRYNDIGMPTGDARVALQSPAEVQRAMHELKFKKMRDRPIYMSVI